MPCQSYESDYRSSNDRELRELQKISDKLARIACKALTELEKNNVETFLLLKDEEVRAWWEQHKIDDAKAAAERKAKRDAAKLRKDALAKLSDEEKKVLGIK